jgi:hypothetical protein
MVAGGSLLGIPVMAGLVTGVFLFDRVAARFRRTPSAPWSAPVRQTQLQSAGAETEL